MKVGIVGDTHMPRFGRELPASLSRGLRDARVELIIHVGDFTGPDIPPLFEALAPLEAVAGNNDPSALAESFGRRKILDVAGARVAVIHGDPEERDDARPQPRRVRRRRGRRHLLRAQSSTPLRAPRIRVAGESGIAHRQAPAAPILVRHSRHRRWPG